MAEIDSRVLEYDYSLPPELIAQRPTDRRSASRLLVVNRRSGLIEHRQFTDLPDYIEAGDCVVVNKTKVRPARLLGRKTTGAAVELLLLSEVDPESWEALSKPGKRLPVGAKVVFDDKLTGQIIKDLGAGRKLVRFFSDKPVRESINLLGRIALPPYIHEELEETDRYQTVFAEKSGSVAAPTAGLHFTERLIKKLEDMDVGLVKLSLDIGIDTFRPIQTELISAHKMHSENYEISSVAAETINGAGEAGGRIVAVGTTTVRALESAAGPNKHVRPGRESTKLFIKPGYRFKVVDVLLTNFHLPRSSLLVMVSAFAGRQLVLRAYDEAIVGRYRFYSFGDAMLII